MSIIFPTVPGNTEIGGDLNTITGTPSLAHHGSQKYIHWSAKYRQWDFKVRQNTDSGLQSAAFKAQLVGLHQQPHVVCCPLSCGVHVFWCMPCDANVLWCACPVVCMCVVRMSCAALCRVVHMPCGVHVVCCPLSCSAHALWCACVWCACRVLSSVLSCACPVVMSCDEHGITTHTDK